MMIINEKFKLKQIVYLITDKEQKGRIVTGIFICGDCTLMYECAEGPNYSKHYDFEISAEKDILATIDN